MGVAGAERLSPIEEKELNMRIVESAAAGLVALIAQMLVVATVML
jgi:hypothetical protein